MNAKYSFRRLCCFLLVITLLLPYVPSTAHAAEGTGELTETQLDGTIDTVYITNLKITVGEDKQDVPVDVDFSDASSTTKQTIKTTTAVSADEITLTVTANSEDAKVYLGESTTAFESGSAVKLSDYQTETVGEDTYVKIPIKLETPASDGREAVTRQYTLYVLVVSYYPVIKTQPTAKVLEYSQYGTAVLKVVAEATGDGTLSYQWYMVGEAEDEKLTDSNATKASYKASKTVLGVRSYYCVVTNTVGGRTYSVKTDVVTVTIYKQFISKLELYENGETKILDGQGSWQGKEFSVTLDDTNTYTLKVLPINKTSASTYSMIVSYNGKAGTVEAYDYEQALTIDASEFPVGSSGYFTVEVGEYDSDAGCYIASELYKFNVTKALAMTDITVTADDAEVSLDKSELESAAKVTTSSAVSADEITLTVTANSEDAKVYLGESTTAFESGSAVKLSDYQTETVGEDTYVKIPIKLETPASDGQEAVTQQYTLYVLLANLFPKITAQPESAAAEQATTGNLVLKVVAEATGGGELSYQWYKVGETGDEKLTDSRATKKSYWVSKSTLGTWSYYCIVTNTVDGKQYSVKTDVVTATIYRAYMRTLTFIADNAAVLTCWGNWSGGEFNVALNDRDDYELRLNTIGYMTTVPYSMTISYNGEAGVRSSYSSSIAIDMTKFPYGDTGYFTVEIGTYSEAAGSYSSSETYRFNITRYPGLKGLSVAENGAQLGLDTDLSAATNMSQTQTKTTQAATGSAVKIAVTPYKSTTKVYIGNAESANTQATINPADYPTLYEGQTPYVSVPIRLVAPNGTEWTYTLLLQVGESRIKINQHPSDLNCYDGDQVSLTVEAVSLDGGVISYQWYKGTKENGTPISGATSESYTPDTSAVGAESYYCVITDTKDGNTFSVKTDIAKVTVYDSKNLTPIIVAQSSSLSCNIGDDVTVFVKVLAPEGAELTYQWCNKAYYYPIEGANEPTFKIPTDYQYGYYLTCLVTCTIDGVEYSVRSNVISVSIKFTEEKGITKAAIIKQPGSYILNDSNEQEDGKYDNTATEGLTVNPFYIYFTKFDGSVHYTLSLYHNGENKYDGAELVKNVTFTQMRVKGSTSSPIETYDVKIAPNEKYAAGEHYFYVVITLVHDSAISGIESVSTKSEILKIVVTEGDADAPWEGKGTENAPFLIKTADDLVKLEQLVSEGDSFSGTYFWMVDDITLPANWTPIGCTKDGTGMVNGTSNLNAFSGNINAAKDRDDLSKGCYTLTVPAGGLPLLGFVCGATVQNLNIYGTQIAGAGLVNNYTGVGLSGSAIVIDNVTLKSGSSTLKSGLITHYGGNGYAAASAGFVVTIRNCKIESGVTVGYAKDQSNIGSIAGNINGTIENCTSYATVYGRNYVGGILGSRDNAMSTCIVKNCTFGGTVEASGSCAGGIVGGGYGNSTAPNGARPTVLACTVTGTVKGNECVGGIFGGDLYVAQTWENVVGSISANTFTGTVSGNKNVGAVIGYLDSLNRYDSISGNT